MHWTKRKDRFFFLITYMPSLVHFLDSKGATCSFLLSHQSAVFTFVGSARAIEDSTESRASWTVTSAQAAAITHFCRTDSTIAANSLNRKREGIFSLHAPPYMLFFLIGSRKRTKKIKTALAFSFVDLSTPCTANDFEIQVWRCMHCLIHCTEWEVKFYCIASTVWSIPGSDHECIDRPSAACTVCHLVLRF